MSPRLRALLANAGLAFASIAVVLAVLEGVARLSERSRGGGKERDEASRYIEHDPRLGWRKKPGARVLFDRREYAVEVAVNSTGLRDPERSYAAGPGTFRILASAIPSSRATPSRSTGPSPRCWRRRCAGRTARSRS